MTDTIISLRVDKRVRNQMKLHQEINWSAVLRRSINEQLHKTDQIDYKRAQQAAKEIDRMRKEGIFKLDRPSVEIIREWREKRR